MGRPQPRGRDLAGVIGAARRAGGMACRRSRIVRTALAAGLIALSAPAHAAEVIERYDAAIQVLADGTLDVTETIRVRAEGAKIRRGIYRDFPLTFEGADGRLRQVTFKLLDVERDGANEPHFTERSFSGIRIYAGDENTFLTPGRYTYRFRYRTGRQLRFLPDGVELNWNVTGNEWDFPILTARAVVRLPDGQSPVRWTAFTGRFGERGNNYSGAIQSDGSLAVSTTGALDPGEGLTLVAELPAGLVPSPTARQQFLWSLMDNRRFIFGGLGLAGLLAFYLTMWDAVGRDPPKGTVIPLFHPPENMSPALTAYVKDWGWRGGWRAFTAAMISLAVKGHLVFDGSEDTPVLRRNDTESRNRPAEHGLPAGERAILRWVDNRGGSVTIDKANGTSLASTFSSFKTAIERENRNKFFRRNVGYFAAGLAITAATIFLVLVFGNLREAEIGLMIATVIVCVFIGVFLIMPLIRVVLGGRSVRSLVMIGIQLLALSIIGSGLSDSSLPAAPACPTASAGRWPGASPPMPFLWC